MTRLGPLGGAPLRVRSRSAPATRRGGTSRDGLSPPASTTSVIRDFSRLAGLGQPDGVDVGADQLLVGQVEAWAAAPSRRPCRSAGGSSRCRGVAGGAVGDDERRLAGAPGPAGPLRVVRRRRRDVAHRHRVEAGDVDAQLHRRRAVEERQVAGRGSPARAPRARPPGPGPCAPCVQAGEGLRRRRGRGRGRRG